MTALKFTFLCGSLEPGRDGVGDYTRLLSGELVRLGHAVHLIALNDPHIESGKIDGALEHAAGGLRFPPGLPWGKRWQTAASAVDRFQPDWLSLQFVCYGLHPKGLPYGFGKGMRRLARTTKTHVMLHELWIGEAVDYALKDRLVGWLQKRLILGLIRSVRPAVMHTSNPIYSGLLASHGFRAGELPLFGNIPVEADLASDWFCNLLRDRGVAITTANRREFLIAAVFGTIHPQWSPDVLVQMVEVLAREQGKRAVFLALGRIGAAGEALWQRLAAEERHAASFLNLGEQSPRRISQCLQNLDFGISPSPWAISGKSGAVAAMLDHGLPVVVGRDAWKLRKGVTLSPTPHPQLFREHDFLEAARSGQMMRCLPRPRLSAVAAQMLSDLDAVSGLAPRGGLALKPTQFVPTGVV